MIQNVVERKVNDVTIYSPRILDILLKDRTSGRNIVWATEDYQDLGDLYRAECEILPDLISREGGSMIWPRMAKNGHRRLNRTKGKAEVFTPSWICNAQNNLVDNAWFGRTGVFNWETGKSWKTNTDQVFFEDRGEKTWKKYVDSPRLEITCGEAPYLVSRYDVVNAMFIPVAHRIGLLDRKLRVVHENTISEEEWMQWAVRAYQSIYGFEYQGDSLLLARENLLYTFIDYLDDKFHRNPTVSELKKIAVIISWNIWQMDGLTFTVPYHNGGGEGNAPSPKYCIIKDWRAVRWKKKGIVEYRALVQTEVG